MLKSIQSDSTGFEDHECPGCGLKREAWSADAGKGFASKGETFCCEGCAEGTGCLCSTRLVAEVIHHPGVQVLDHGRLHAERRRRQLKRDEQPERRSRGVQTQS